MRARTPESLGPPDLGHSQEVARISPTRGPRGAAGSCKFDSTLRHAVSASGYRRAATRGRPRHARQSQPQRSRDRRGPAAEASLSFEPLEVRRSDYAGRLRYTPSGPIPDHGEQIPCPNTRSAPTGRSSPFPPQKDYAAEMERLGEAGRRGPRRGQGDRGRHGRRLRRRGHGRDRRRHRRRQDQGKPSKFVIGCQRPSTRSYWKIPLLNRGESPVKAEDPEVDPMIARCVNEKKTLTATYNSDCLKLADCVVVDVQCDYTKHDLGNMRTGEAEMAALEATMRTIGEKIPPECLVLIETTVAPGTTEFVAWPILKKAFADARHRVRAAAGPQLRAGHAGPRVRRSRSATSGGSAPAATTRPASGSRSSCTRCSTPRSSR